jgi:hypothetical protein
MMDLENAGEILPSITWNAGGLIVPLFGSKYYHLIEECIAPLLYTYDKKVAEELISYSLNHGMKFGENLFWQEQLCNFSMPLSYNNVNNVQVTRNQLLDLLECFKW